MAVLEILTYPNPMLRAETRPIETFDESLKKLIADMWETMYFSKGVGLQLEIGRASCRERV